MTASGERGNEMVNDGRKARSGNEEKMINAGRRVTRKGELTTSVSAGDWQAVKWRTGDVVKT